MTKHLLHLDSIGEQGQAEMHLTCEHDPDDDEFHPEYDVSPVGVIRTVRERLDVCWLRMQWDHMNTDLISSLPGPLTWPLPVTGEWDGDDCYLIRDTLARLEPTDD